MLCQQLLRFRNNVAHLKKRLLSNSASSSSNHSSFVQIEQQQRDEKWYSGKATPEATRDFISSSGLLVHHNFRHSNFIINPIIHGPPPGKVSSTESERCMAQAIVKNKSNCVFVYSHRPPSRGGIWHATRMAELLEFANMPRKALVTIAGLGKPGKTPEDIIFRLKDALDLTGLSEIDFGFVQV